MCDKGLLSLRGMAYSEDGEYCAYGISGKGSDWVTIKVSSVQYDLSFSIFPQALSEFLQVKENSLYNCLKFRKYFVIIDTLS